jgi:hypothetical protein
MSEANDHALGDVGVEKPVFAAKKNNPMALTGFILGCCAVVLYQVGIIPILALIFSSLGISHFDPAVHKNRWMGGVGLALGVIFTLMYLVAYHHLG